MKTKIVSGLTVLMALFVGLPMSEADLRNVVVVAEIEYEQNTAQLIWNQDHFVCDVRASTTQAMLESQMTADKFATYCSLHGIRADGSQTGEVGGMIDQSSGSISIPFSEPVQDLYWSIVAKAVDVDLIEESSASGSQSGSQSSHIIDNFQLNGSLDMSFKANLGLTSAIRGKTFTGTANLGVDITYHASEESIVAFEYEEETQSFFKVVERHATLVGVRDYWLPAIPVITEFEFTGKETGCDAADAAEARFGPREIGNFYVTYEVYGTVGGNITIDLGTNRFVELIDMAGFSSAEDLGSKVIFRYTDLGHFRGRAEFTVDYEHNGLVELGQNSVEVPKDPQFQLDPPGNCPTGGSFELLPPVQATVTAAALARGIQGTAASHANIDVIVGFDHEHGLH